MKLNQFGARVGGPIVIPGLYDGKGKAFYFAPLRAGPLPEQLHAYPHGVQPARRRRLVPLQFGSELREVNVLQLAAANGQISAKDPIMLNLHRADRRVHQDHRYAQRQRRSALRLVRVAESRDAVRAPAHVASRLQPHRQPSLERIVDADHRQADSGLLEQCRPAIPGCAEPARLRVDAAADALALRRCCRRTLSPSARRSDGPTPAARTSAILDIASRNDPARSPTRGLRHHDADDTTDWHTSNGPTWRRRRPTASTRR